MKRIITIFLTIFVISFSIVNLYLYYHQGEISYSYLSGKIIKEIPNLPMYINLSLVAFIIQWVILILIVLIAYARYLKNRRETKVHLTIQEIKKRSSKTETDLDVVYRILKEKKRLPIYLISKSFNIDKEKAIEWAKILENSGLAILEYPAFGEPEVRINEKEDENEELNEKEIKKKEQEKRDHKAKKG